MRNYFTKKGYKFLMLLCTGMVFLNLSAAVAAESTTSSASQAEGQDEENLAELNKQLNNPVSSVWSLSFQNNFTFLEGRLTDNTKEFYNLNFQPALPFRLTKDWNLIARPVFPFFASRDVYDPLTRTFDGKSGIGDIALLTLLSPAKVGKFLWGVGPTFVFPTASPDKLGSEKWQTGPAAVGLYLGEKWIFGLFPQHWWSVGGSGRRNVSVTNIQYFIWHLLPENWQVGMGPNITINWKASGGNAYTVPIGFGVGKLIKFRKLPVKFALEAQYSVVRPDDLGTQWNIRFTVTPVIPPLIKNVLIR